MSRYKAYPKYKDSGVEWADKLPEQWGTVHLRWISRLYAGGTPSKAIEEYWENGSVPWLNSGEVNQRIITEASTYITESAYKNSSAKWIPKCSLVMALAGQGKTKGMVAQLAIDATCNQSMSAIVPHAGINARYLYWWLDSNYQNIRNTAGGDLRDGLNLELLGDIGCPVPCEEEQVEIVSFLDHETAKIDSLIEKQQRLIELLKEKRQAVISHAVTKGLNPNVSMKDSGVEWLGQVPVHWAVCELKRLVSVRGGFAFNSELFVDDGIPVIRISDINSDGYVSLNLCKKIIAEDNTYQQYKVVRGELLMAMTGATIGKAGWYLSDEPAFLNQRVGVFKFKSETLLSEYLWYILNSSGYQEHINITAFGGAQPNVSDAGMVSYYSAIPTLEEQQKIIFHLRSVIKKIDDLVSKAESQIYLMQERRIALISAAVTGKIDVRDW